ncbi:DUF1254 domain-containing protein [Nocardia sp. NPDC046763]|uniref:DUF1254 domain-containing protein n=1 Tax=Nocardia sp. NPDC046763 TaxID=3155256 RepID=UPI00340C2750
MSDKSDVSMGAAVSAYVYTYPLVSIEVTRRQSTNVPYPNDYGSAPMNQFANMRTVPDASFTNVVRPNVDTLYSSMFYDVSVEPLIIGVPDMRGRYYLFPILDMWTNVQASPGTRTLGVRAGYEFAITGPNWQGTLPEGVLEYPMPTDSGWIIGRIKVNGSADDVEIVRNIQDRLTAVPLSAYGTAYVPPENTDLHPDWPTGQEVAAYIAGLTPQQYWDLYYSSLSHRQTLPDDKEILAQLAEAGWTPEQKLNLDELPAADRAVWELAWPEALSRIEVNFEAVPENGWQIARSGMGFYGTEYLFRSTVAYGGLGANLPQDAIYPAAYVDGRSEPLSGDNDYILRFDADQVPPVDGFWSLTMYDENGFFIANELNRYAVRGEDLRVNSDGSVEIYIQSQNPGPEQESNWLPAPGAGVFNLMLRLYWPGIEVIDGIWNPPAVHIAP